MKTKAKIFALGLLGISSLVACTKDEIVEPINNQPSIVGQDLSSTDIDGAYIVQLDSNFANGTLLLATTFDDKDQAIRAEINKWLQSHNLNIPVGFTYHSALKGFSTQLTDQERMQLEQLPEVVRIESNIVMHVVAEREPVANNEGQIRPYGSIITGTASGIGKLAFILDTGIDLDHQDLNVNERMSINFTQQGLVVDEFKGSDSPEDANGHGTHVAGIIGAINNNIGTVGIAHGAELVAVRVLDKEGRGASSMVLKGLDYVAFVGLPGNVLNISLIGKGSVIVDEAVAQVATRGVLVAIAAGNQGGDIQQWSPARLNTEHVYTISAMDQFKSFAEFSNHGAGVDFSAPGVAVQSTYLNGQYASMSGTSMAAPHFAGVLMVKGTQFNIGGYVSLDPDQNNDPYAVVY